jgi:hypothetical protein
MTDENFDDIFTRILMSADANLTPEKTYDELVAQIYNMNDTIIRDYKGIKWAAIFGIIGLSFFIFYLLGPIISQVISNCGRAI